MTGCLVIVWSLEKKELWLNSDVLMGHPSHLVTWPRWLFSNMTAFMAIYSLTATAFYDSFAENRKLFLVFSKTTPYQTTDLFNDRGVHFIMSYDCHLASYS